MGVRVRVDVCGHVSVCPLHSMDLMCWLDIEQYKRLPQKDRAQREDRSKDIRSGYISRKYFFGPNSPASREEQEEVPSPFAPVADSSDAPVFGIDSPI